MHDAVEALSPNMLSMRADDERARERMAIAAFLFMPRHAIIPLRLRMLHAAHIRYQRRACDAPSSSYATLFIDFHECQCRAAMSHTIARHATAYRPAASPCRMHGLGTILPEPSISRQRCRSRHRCRSHTVVRSIPPLTAAPPAVFAPPPATHAANAQRRL